MSMTDRILSNLRGTMQTKFRIAGVDIGGIKPAGGAFPGLRIDENQWFGTAKGSLVDIVDLGDIGTSQAVNMSTQGLHFRLRLTTNSAYTLTITQPPAAGMGAIRIDNAATVDQTITWLSYVDWGVVGAPVIPASSSCLVIFFFDAYGVVHGIHNCPAASGGGGISLADARKVSTLRAY